MKKKFAQRLRTFGIWLACTLMEWNSHIRYDLSKYTDANCPIGWRDHLRWFIEGKLSVLFGWAWAGSDEELAAVDNGEVPVEYMSDRQLQYFIQTQREVV